jgi:hypothetical protein
MRRRRDVLNLNTAMERTRTEASREQRLDHHPSQPLSALCDGSAPPFLSRCCCPHRLTHSHSLIVALVWHASVTS